MSILYTCLIFGKLPRMARSPGFRAFKRALQRAVLLKQHEQHPELKRLDPVFQGRRQFLKSSVALGAAALPFTALIANCATAPQSSAGPLGAGEDPVVIIGGGLSGLTAAYRLGRAGIGCEVFEAQSRLGGRVFTHENFNSEGMFCELGGELIDSTHEDILGLARELGLRRDDFRPFDAQVKHHQFFFEGRRYFDADLTAACEPIAHRLLQDMRKVFKDFQDPSVTYHSPTPEALRLDQVSLEQYLDSMPDVDRWVREAVNIAYLTEYGLDTGEQSCINLMMLIDPVAEHGFGIYGESDESMRIHGGNSRMVEALAKSAGARAKINPSHRLVRIEDRGSQLLLTFDGAPGGTRVVAASRVLCTVPFSVLREVEGLQALALTPVKRQCISTLGYGQNTKRMVGFKSRHWRERQGTLPAASGYTFTDLPSQTFWESSRAQPGKSGIMTTFLGGSAAIDPTRGSIDSILSDLEAICPGTRSLYDGNQVLFRWPDNPFVKGSYTCPRVGQYTTLIGSPGETELGGKLLFAGEHVSVRYQGYMNGAVQTGNQAARSLIAELRGHAHAGVSDRIRGRERQGVWA